MTGSTAKPTRKPPFLVEDTASGVVDHTATTKSIPAGQAPRGTYFQVDHYEDACWYIKNHYADSDPTEGSASITVTTNFGDWTDKVTLDHLVFRLKRAAKSQYYAAISFGLRLYAYSQDSKCIATRDVSENTTDRYQVRCVDLSADGRLLFCSKKDSLFRFDHNLKLLDSWKTPAKRTREAATSPEIAQALSVLGLTKNPSNNDIKTAYRKCLLKVHPDVNSQDPSATEKTRVVIASYELLTSPKYRDENLRYHNEIQMGFGSIRFPAFGDDITATQTTGSQDSLYVGCYSGKSYTLRNDGTFTSLYNCKAPVRAIRELGRYVYLVSDDFFDVLADGEFINRFADKDRFGRLVWGKTAIMEVTTRQIRIFSLQGSLFACLHFRDNIADAYLPDSQLKVVTANKIYLFSIQTSSGVNRLNDMRLLKSQA
jgi:hypothetical protein